MAMLGNVIESLENAMAMLGNVIETFKIQWQFIKIDPDT